jgi:hypothetical protein
MWSADIATCRKHNHRAATEAKDTPDFPHPLMNELDLMSAQGRALATFEAIRSSRLFSPGHRLFGRRRWWLVRRDYEALWPFADAWSALCSLGSLPGYSEPLAMLDEMMRGLSSYSREGNILESQKEAGFESVVTPPLGSGGDRYYDDNAWLGLALVRHHDLTKNSAVLRLAQRVFAFVISGWSTNTTWLVPGGIRWKEPTSNRSRNTCANGPAAELGARLHQETGDGNYLEWAIRIYDWTRRALLNADALYADQIAPGGNLTSTIWSYNQGSMIGAGVLIAEETGHASYVDQAVETAASYVAQRSVGDLLTQDPAFNAVLFRNLLMLDGVRPDNRYRDLMTDYSRTMWLSQRQRHGFFAGSGSPLNNTAAMLQIFALLAGAQPHP